MLCHFWIEQLFCHGHRVYHYFSGNIYIVHTLMKHEHSQIINNIPLCFVKSSWNDLMRPYAQKLLGIAAVVDDAISEIYHQLPTIFHLLLAAVLYFFCQNTMRCHFNTVNLLTNLHKRHSIAHRLVRGMGSILWVRHLIDNLLPFL